MDDDDNIYLLDVENELEHFVSHYPLPQRAKITEGYLDAIHDIDFPIGDVVHVKRLSCPAVTLAITVDDGRVVRTSVPVNHPARFQAQPLTGGKTGIKYPTVEHLVRLWPREAKSTKAYTHRRDPRKSFEAGERFTLERLVSVNGIQFLECKFKRRQRLLQLPMDCEGCFNLIKDERIYTIEEIIYKQPPRERLLTLLEGDPINRTFPLPDIPVGYKGKILMEKPPLMVEVSPFDSPGDVFAVPITTPIVLSPREETYTGACRVEHPLKSFIESNGSRLPMYITITNWNEVTDVCDRIGIRPGSGVILHEKTYILKALTQSTGGEYYVIPLRYHRKLKVIPSVFYGVVELYDASIKRPLTVQVIKAASRKLLLPNVYVASVSDILRCTPGDRQAYRPPGSRDELSIVWMELLDRKTGKVIRKVQVDESMDGVFEEILDSNLRAVDNLSRIQTLELPVPVQFISGGDAKVEEVQDGVPINKNLIITHIIHEPCVLANRDKRNHRSFNLPLRTDLSLMLEKTLPPDAYQGRMPQLAWADGFGEQITEQTYNELQKFSTDLPYEDLTDLVRPGIPARGVPSQSRSGTRKVKAPIPSPAVQRSISGPAGVYDDGYLQAVRERRTSPRGDLLDESTTEPNVPRDSGVNMEEETYDLIYDYADLKQVLYGAEKPKVQIPHNSDISQFSQKEMLVFLEYMTIPATAIAHFATLHLDGKGFSQLSNEELAQHNLVGNPMIVHFRDRSRHALATSNL